MIDRNELIQNLKKAAEKTKLVKLSDVVRQEGFPLTGLIDLTFNADKLVASRSAFILEHIIAKDPNSYADELHNLLSRIKNVKQSACIKHYAKLMLLLTSPEMPRVVRERMKAINLEAVIEQCFDWMTNDRSIVTVKYSAAGALFNLRHRYPWLAEELSVQLEKLMHNASPMLAAKVSDLLSYLHCEE